MIRRIGQRVGPGGCHVGLRRAADQTPRPPFPELGATASLVVGRTPMQIVCGVEKAALDKLGIKLETSLPEIEGVHFLRTGQLSMSGAVREAISSFGWRYGLGEVAFEINSAGLVVAMNFPAQSRFAEGLSEKLGVKLSFLNVQQLAATGGLPKKIQDRLLKQGIYYFIGVTNNNQHGCFFDVAQNNTAAIYLEHQESTCGVVLGRILA